MDKVREIWKRLGAFLKFDLPIDYDSIRELFLQIHTGYQEDYPGWSTRATRRKGKPSTNPIFDLAQRMV
jgi:hypothetical protein